PGARPPRGSRDALQRASLGAGAAARLDQPDDRVLAKAVRRSRRPAQKEGPLTEPRSVVVEREFPHPPEKLWRALTQPHLIQEWLMQNDFAPNVGHRFNMRTTPYGTWNGIVDCEVLAIEPNRTLSYTWDSGEGSLRVTSVVTWT